MTDRVLRDKGGRLSPVVSVVTRGGRSCVLKDYRPLGPLARGILGPMLVRREHGILKHLEGIPGIPRTFGIVEKGALLVEYIEGKTIGKYRAGDLPDEVFEQLCATVRAMHRRGVVHLDLRQKKNILISGDRPYLLDFASALRTHGVLGRQLTAVDESALLKFKQRNFPHLVTKEDRAFLDRHRFLRRFWIFTPRGRRVR